MNATLLKLLSEYAVIPAYCFGVRLWELLGLNRIKSKINRSDVELSRQNYKTNSEKDAEAASSTFNRLINDQCGLTGRAFRYGRFSADYNVCEVIAMHNVRVMLGQNSCLSETIRSVQNRGGMFCQGKWGTKISHIGTIMKNEYGLPSKAIRKIENIDRDGAYIISFWNDRKNILKGVHTVTLCIDKGTFTLYNCSPANRTVALDYKAFVSRFKRGFIIARYFGNITRE